MSGTYKILGKSWLYQLCFFIRNLLNPVFHFQEVSILAYHSLSASSIETAILPEIFEEQIRFLRKRGVSFVPLIDVVTWRRKKGTLPRNAVAITFDDGYADFETAALPLLEKYSIPVTLFAVGNEEASRAALANPIPLLTPEAFARVGEHPLVSIGYHSYSHANLARMSGEELAHEVAPPAPLEYFAFPGGNYSKAAIAAVHDAGYDAGFSIKPNLVSRHSPRYLFPRSVITTALAPMDVYLRTTKAIAWYRRLTLPL